MTYTLHLGDCIEAMRAMPENSIDSIVTDPPYGLSFMGKRWDYDVPSVDIWVECLRVLKPGGHLLAFAGTRTQHRMAVRIEDAGFEIRDMIAWVYGSGFPKSHNLTGEHDGWGTALKPALEPVTVARKPLIGTVATNVLEHGTGAIHIDACRIGATDAAYARNCSGDRGHGGTRSIESRGATDMRQGGGSAASGRWPANLIHDGSAEVVALFPAEAGASAPVKGSEPTANGFSGPVKYSGMRERVAGAFHADAGSAARFFYCAKTNRKDRNEGLPIGDQKAVSTNATMRQVEGADWSARNGNHHPTVKPTDLMAYLLRLVTPIGGIVLDPFMGSGSTGKAAMREGFQFIGCELDPGYLAIAKARIEYEQKKAMALLDPNPEQQLSLFI
ncbi:MULTISPECIES: DNA-methyltransferase [unclassified Pseudomonas]|uniref:DNA-methyltransferase n=1 Tax=unclassified Pseudomonas TaxID=196821 RepID=UPI0004898947|nr:MULTISPECIES: site-specific DNA-methyltransferase [unclassified Pseudomonas]RAS34066.1 site-specific DNA-methyltransferase (adenine-specific) [Pseudomonas sp. URMO17WK12:I7]SME90883.1 site-specific DNA-methyltransferase (adenine-specific) [Pseudomonas sp. URMO17WK12:I5]